MACNETRSLIATLFIIGRGDSSRLTTGNSITRGTEINYRLGWWWWCGNFALRVRNEPEPRHAVIGLVLSSSSCFSRGSSGRDGNRSGNNDDDDDELLQQW